MLSILTEVSNKCSVIIHACNKYNYKLYLRKLIYMGKREKFLLENKNSSEYIILFAMRYEFVYVKLYRKLWESNYENHLLW